MVTATIDQTIIPGTSSRFDFIERVRNTVVDVMEPVMPTTDGIKTSERYFINVIPTSSQTVVDDITNIEIYAKENDIDQFIEAVTNLDLENFPSQSIIRIIDLALSIGLVKLPQQLAQRAKQIYPDDKEIVKYQKILAPPKIINSNLPPYPPAELNVKWLKEFRNEYKGKWVALKDGILLASAVSFEELKSKVEIKKKSHILVTRV